MLRRWVQVTEVALKASWVVVVFALWYALSHLADRDPRQWSGVFLFIGASLLSGTVAVANVVCRGIERRKRTGVSASESEPKGFDDH